VPIECANKSTTRFGIKNFREVYHPGDAVNVHASFSKFPLVPDEDGAVQLWVKNNTTGSWLAAWGAPEDSADDPCQVKFGYRIPIGPYPSMIGTYTVRVEYDGGSGSATFKVVQKDDLKIPRIYGNRADLCRDDVTKAYMLLNGRAPSHYDFAMRMGESVSCNSWDDRPKTNVTTAWRRTIVLGTVDYEGGDRYDPHWIAGVIVHQACHINQFREGLTLDLSRWDLEKECGLMQIDTWKRIIGMQSWIDDIQGPLERHEPWWTY
jgi:hypothetical protein